MRKENDGHRDPDARTGGLEMPLATVYPIAIGRPRKALKTSAAITLKPPSNGSAITEGGTKK